MRGWLSVSLCFCKIPEFSGSYVDRVYTEFFGAYYDDDVPDRTNREFQIEAEIVVRADGKADNGLLYGAKVEFQNSTPTLSSTGVGTDEASVYLAGTWGRLELGDFDGAADTLA